MILNTFFKVLSSNDLYSKIYKHNLNKRLVLHLLFKPKQARETQQEPQGTDEHQGNKRAGMG